MLFDHIFEQMTGPSTPGNLAIIGAQSGATQWMLHPDEAYQGNGASGKGVPVMNDTNPYWGSIPDATSAHPSGQPANPGDHTTNPQFNLTFATLPLSLAGRELENITQADADPLGDLDDVAEDVVD